jgi:hypothetical protein
MKSKESSLLTNQRGIVSIAVTVILMTIITLIVLGFATIARREQQQALDRQLSADAYYAAESGVNYFAEQLRNGSIGGDVDDCNTSRTTILADPAVRTLGDGVEYTCALISQSVDSVDFPLGKDESRVLRLTIPATETIGSVEIDWEDELGTRNFACNDNHYLPQGEFTANTPYNPSGILCGSPSGMGAFSNSTAIMRTTIIPTTATFTRNDLINRSPTYFLYPKVDPSSATTDDFGSKSASMAADQQGDFLDAYCSTAVPPSTKFCRARITNINTNLVATNTVYLRLRSIYRSSNVKVRVFNSSGAQMEINGAQAKIDVTAKASGVVKRIQAKIPLTQNYYLPEFGLQTAQSLCKRFSTWPATDGITYEPFDTTDLVRGHAGSPLDIDISDPAPNDNNTCNPTAP